MLALLAEPVKPVKPVKLVRLGGECSSENESRGRTESSECRRYIALVAFNRMQQAPGGMPFHRCFKGLCV